MGLHKKPCPMDKTSLSLSFVTGKVITYDDYSVVRSYGSDRDRFTAAVQLLLQIRWWFTLTNGMCFRLNNTYLL